MMATGIGRQIDCIECYVKGKMVAFDKTVRNDEQVKAVIAHWMEKYGNEIEVCFCYI